MKIPKMSVQGLGDYDRDNGYQQGGVTLEYETRRMTQDRGRKFSLILLISTRTILLPLRRLLWASSADVCGPGD